MSAMASVSITEFLLELAAQHDGVLTTAVVIEAARPPSSPIHSEFDWDNSVAADKWRIEQARRLLRVVVRYESPEQRRVEARVFVSLTPDRETGAGYRVTKTVLADPDLRRQLLADARAAMQLFIQKYRELEELTAVFDAMQEFVGPDTDPAPQEGDEASP